MDWKKKIHGQNNVKEWKLGLKIHFYYITYFSKK